MIAPWSRDGVLWGAGFFEGEGCLHGRASKADNGRYCGAHVTWQMTISNTDLDSLARFATVFGGKVYGPRHTEGCKPIWHWQARSPTLIYAICAALFPFMGERRRAKFEEFMRYFAAYRYNGGVRRPLSAETKAKISATLSRRFAAGAA